MITGFPTERCGYTYISVLGEGTNAVAYHVKDSRNNDYVVKEIKIGVKGKVIDVAEIDIGFRLIHPNIRRNYEFLVPSNICPLEVIAFTSDYAQYTLHRYLWTVDSSITQRICLLHQIASGLAFLHSSGVLHLDLKPENILIQNNRAMIADFDRSQYVDSPVEGRIFPANKEFTTVWYRAPEHFMGYYMQHRDIPAKEKGHYRDSSDIWSFGIITLDTLSRMKSVFIPGVFNDNIVWRQITTQFQPPHLKPYLNSYLSAISALNANQRAVFVDLLLRVFDPIPEKRIKMHDIVSHDIFMRCPPSPTGPPQILFTELGLPDDLNDEDLELIEGALGSIIIHYGEKEAGNAPLNIFFLAIDLIHRCFPYILRDYNTLTQHMTDSSEHERKKFVFEGISEACIDIAENLYYYSGPNATEMQYHVILWLRGIINRDFLYASAANVDELVGLYPTIINVQEYSQIKGRRRHPSPSKKDIPIYKYFRMVWEIYVRKK